jgi:hypothetical protein
MALRMRRARSSQARPLSPWRNAFIATSALPASVLGPVERSHGCQPRIRAVWRARRSGVQPLELRAARLLFGALLDAANGFMAKDNSRLQ